jgi:DNA-binding XRE family transcriptional regulator
MQKNLPFPNFMVIYFAFMQIKLPTSMETTFNQRFKMLLSYYRLNQSQAGRKIGVSHQVIGSWLQDSSPKLDLLLSILKAFPEISLTWLVAGEGQMLKEKEEISFASEGKSNFYTSNRDYEMLKQIWMQDRDELQKIREINRELTNELMAFKSPVKSKEVG